MSDDYQDHDLSMCGNLQLVFAVVALTRINVFSASLFTLFEILDLMILGWLLLVHNINNTTTKEGAANVPLLLWHLAR